LNTPEFANLQNYFKLKEQEGELSEKDENEFKKLKRQAEE
jgi:hypothetical protein